jgi:hypothetical protein
MPAFLHPAGSPQPDQCDSAIAKGKRSGGDPIPWPEQPEEEVLHIMDRQ